MRRDVFTSFLLPLSLLFCASPARALEFRVCVKPPDVPPGLTQWAYEQGSATVWTTRSRMEFARKVEGRATFTYDPYAPPESVRVLPIPYNTLKCPPPPRPKSPPAKDAPKEEKKAEDGSPSQTPGKRGGDEERKGGGDEGSVEKRVEKHRLPQPKEGPPPPRASAPAQQQDPVLPRQGVLPRESILPQQEAKWADKEHGLVDRGGALPQLVDTADRKPLNVTSCEQTKEGCPARKQKTRAGAILEQVVIAGAIFNLQMNEDLYRPDGKEYGIVGGMNEAHQVVTNKLREAMKGIPFDDLPRIWKAYQKVYADSPHWLKAIEHYFD
ncbi:hypothetical protein [Polyangium sp. 6x1]|uniref:hypothetical protein n=1 Tax=Polyangium sp. 6x1 TaxID=3042689 RepID=UPI002482B7E8|nr:hypothetical protein [Polyangium sp. 6x1]MDI1445739.1 hypothetical protein [Polyangium sp. 6x1]